MRRIRGAAARGEGDNDPVTDMPRRAVTRTAKLASLPLGFAGRTALGVGKRVGGRPADLVTAEIQRATAEQVFKVLGELKGGAMKFGQAMSVFEAAFPEEMAGPYRATLTKLQEGAPPMDAATVHRVLAEAFGRQWRRRFQSFDDVPAAAASIGQVHRGVWKDGTDVAVKVQYPGAGEALKADLAQVVRMGRLFGVMVPGMDVRPLVEELRERMVEELDYSLERDAQRAFAEAYRGDPDIAVPDVLDGAEHVVVSEWMDGLPLSRVIAGGTQAERNHAGQRYVRFLFASPARAGMLHADPHPGNYRILPDGRLGVLDYGAVARLPGGLPPSIGRLLVRRPGRRRRDGRGRAARRRVHQATRLGRRRVAAELSRAVRRAGLAGHLPLRPTVDAGPVQADQRPPDGELVHRAEAQPPAGVPPRPPGLARRRRRPVPARGRGLAAERAGDLPSRVHPTELRQGHQYSGSSLASRERRWSRLQRSQ